MQTYAVELMDKDWLTISQAAKYLRVSPDTLRRWEKRKLLRPHRSPTGWRYYDKKQLDYVFVQRPEIGKAIQETNSGNKLPTQKIENPSLLQKLPILLVFLIALNITLILFYLFTLISAKPLSPVP